ncbi:ABC transporter ATP-binding protein [Xylophilus sp.]|uniref:ABC transporter ATP-binding protein n=1 Tax=Xylophilus sp. TaxID=2653893 RepID=UPI0013B97512|nr:ABC transporter ATP-binding protein [Xylophilus sp.]KAF1050125.1 MAG: Glutathione import ATP-binding protein GsiA [Xylophilus sp.]
MNAVLKPASAPLIAVEDLKVSFGTHQAVRGVNFEVAPGETLALVGESGCGKSTTSLAILRLLPRNAHASGRIAFGGRDLLALDEKALRGVRGNEISMIFQEPMTSLNPVLTIGEQITEVLRTHQGLNRWQARERAIALLDRVKIPNPQRRIDDYAHHLSGGQRQRVMIAIAVACQPKLLIADEPTTALDVTIQAQILELLRELSEESGMGLLLITHDLGVVGQWADRVAVMYGGEVLESASAERIFSAPSHPYTRGLLGASLRLDADLHYRQVALPEVRVRGDADHRAFTLETHGVPPTRAPDPQAAPLLSVQDLRTVYDTAHGPVAAVDGVSFDIRPGETVGLVGESGCGKSTLSKTLLRLLQPESGKIVLEGTDLAPLDERALRPWRGRVQMVFQDPYGSLNPRHRIGDILDAALRVNGVADRTERRQRIADILDRVGLPAAAVDRWPHEFSGGQRQRIGLARTLVLRPSLVICDEPVSSLDVSVRAQILNLLVELKEAFDLSYLFISHDLSVVKYMADRVLVMHAGRIVERGDHDRLWAEAQHPYTQTLIRAVPSPRFAPPPLVEETAPAWFHEPLPPVYLWQFAI